MILIGNSFVLFDIYVEISGLKFRSGESGYTHNIVFL